MLRKKSQPIKYIKTININNKTPSNFGNYSTVSNDSVIITTNSNSKSRFLLTDSRKKNIFNSNEKNPGLKRKFNYSTKSTWASERRAINRFNDYFSYNKDKKKNKENISKENQVTLFFNNSFLNNYYNNININRIKINKNCLKLNDEYTPHNDYYKIVKNDKNLVNAFMSQTKSNFNNSYKIMYSNPDSRKRKYIQKCFDSIKKNKNKNIDTKNSIRNIAMKEIFKKTNKITKKKKNNHNYASAKNNPVLIIPSSINMKYFFTRCNKMNIKTMKLTDNISKENAYKIIENNKERIVKSAFYRNNHFFKTVPKAIQEFEKDNNLDFSKVSSIEFEQ